MGVRKRTTIRGQHIDTSRAGQSCAERGRLPALRLYTAVYSSGTPHLKLLFFHEKVVDTWENMDYTKFNLKS